MPKGIVLDDYSGLAGAGAALQGFAKGFQDAKDHELKRQEFDAKMKAHAAQVERDAIEAAVKKRLIDPKYQKQEQIEKFAAHNQEPTYNEAGELTGSTYKPEYVQMQKEKAEADPFGLKGFAATKAKNEASDPYNTAPKAKKEQVDVLSRGVADRKSIKGDIEAGLAQLEDPSKTDDEKLIAGRELLKTLNSTQGKDAIGAEEAKRLGSLLEYKIIPRMGEPGNAFGRDIPMFTTQVRNNLNRLSSSIEKSEAEIHGLLGGKGLVGGMIKDKKGPPTDIDAKKKRLEELRAKKAKAG